MVSRKALRRLLLFTGLHALLTLVLTLYAFSAGMAAFDCPELPPSRSAALAGRAANVLGLPLRLLWTPWASMHLPNTVEWLAFLANSALWGLGLTGVTSLRPDHDARRRAD